MSLIAWYPLNGNLRNIGTDGEDLTQFEGTPTYVDGKTGKAVSFSSDNVNQRLTRSLFLKQNNFSWCIWVKPKLLTTNTFHYAVCNGRADYNLDGWGLGFSRDMSTAKVECGSLRYNFTPKLDIWTHITFTIDENNIATIYMNGIKVHQSSVTTLPDFSEGTLFSLGCFKYATDDIYPMSGCLCDFRYYNHCLTQSEVSEIAKGLMLHYSFENPYVTETTNIPHSLIEESSEVTFGNDSTGDYVIRNGMTSWSGLTINRISVKPGRYYTWSMEVMSIKDIEYVIDGNMECSNSSHASSNDMHFDIIRGYSHINHKLDGSDTLPKGKLEAYKWTRIYFTVKVKQDCTNPKLFHTFVPYIPSGDSSVKVYYRNSQLEEKPYDTPYTPSNREAGLIRDNSGMGNDGTQVYQRIEIPITPKTQTTSSTLPQYGGYTNVYDPNLKTYTINNFSGADNQTGMLGTIKYLSRYHYLNSKICYEFDIKLQDITVTDGKTIRILQQGPTIFKDDTYRWLSSPVQGVDITSRLKNGSTGVYHVCIERIIDNADCVTNVDYYEFGLRFDYVKSGTVTVSNLHAYYGSLDTSTLSLSDNSAIGTHSAYFNGKNRINCGVVVPEEMDELTLSCWVYKEDWSTLNPNWSTTEITPSIIGNIDAGGFGLKVENGNNTVNWTTYYKDHNYGQDNLIDCSDFTSGWHLFTGVSTRTKKSLYVDGNIVNSNDITWNTPIHSKDNVANIRKNIYVGTEVNGGYFTNLENVYIDDVRLYATALSDKDIKALYNVKAKIDNKSNLYCNQLVETKSENMMKPLNEVDLNNDLAKFYSSGTFSYKDGIIKYTISSATQDQAASPGMFIRNSCYGGRLVDNKRYKYSFWVRVSKKGTYLLGDERMGHVTKSLESGKWYYIEKEGLATGVNTNFIIYNGSKNYASGDTIEIRDFQMYRLYDDENYNPGPNIKGQYKTFELNETFNEDVENSGATIVDKYEAEWLEVFYHNNNNCKVFFSNQTEALHTNSQYKFSILDQLENFRGTDNKFEFLLEYPDDFPNEYNRWKQTDNPVTVSEVIGGDPYKAAGYESVHIDWDSNRTDSSICNTFSGLLRSSRSSTHTLIDGSIGHDNWHIAIGAMRPWNGGVPSPMIQPALGRIKLYVRIDNLPNRNEIFRQYKRQTKTKEIIEI